MTYRILLALIVSVSMVRSEGNVTASQLLGVLSHGTSATTHKFKTDQGAAATVSVFQISTTKKAYFFQADMDIDCDGEPDAICNSTTDPWFYPELSVGKGIHAAQTPFYVVPLTFSNYVSGVPLGQVAAVIYKNTVAYGPFLDECGVTDVIGEASYAMASLLGVDPDPSTGGTDGPVSYIIFAGTDAKLGTGDYANHTKAVTAGNARAKELVDYFSSSIGSGGRALAKSRTIGSENTPVYVFSYSGRLILRQQAGSCIRSGLKPGMYIVRYGAARGLGMETIVIQ
jgi:hypothetical protein